MKRKVVQLETKTNLNFKSFSNLNANLLSLVNYVIIFQGLSQLLMLNQSYFHPMKFILGDYDLGGLGLGGFSLGGFVLIPVYYIYILYTYITALCIYIVIFISVYLTSVFNFFLHRLNFLHRLRNFQASFKNVPYKQGIVQSFGTEICPKPTVDQLMTRESSLYACLGYGHF